ncbi:glycosyltransferase [Paenibacillus sp. PK4536]|uniref:glycosyltransferase n=1 Tax=Paenibacillus sp. PK4536 TaxID=3024576 RepID=UPI002358CFB7|nr:glycosyltransferase [Paenibacillus sp. PK4536]WIM39759.1 glycosyltransferase [Paenibacillus sp. PK4536]
MKEPVFVSVVMYTYNDEHVIADALIKMDQKISASFKNYELILVNDASTDKTLENAREAIAKLHGDTTIINLSRKHGVESSMMAGLNKSIGDFVFEVESMDVNYSFELLYEMFKVATGKGYDIVAATSGQTGWKSKLFYKLLNSMSYLNLSLSTENVRLVTRRALNAMLNLKEKVRYRKALYEFTGYSKTLISYKTDKADSHRKMNRENFSLAIDALVSFSNAGLKLSHYLSIAFFLFSIFMGAYALYNYFFNKSVVEGWTTLMIIICFGFAGMFFIIGIIGEYIARILIETQNRPFYSASSVEMYKEKRQSVNK